MLVEGLVIEVRDGTGIVVLTGVMVDVGILGGVLISYVLDVVSGVIICCVFDIGVGVLTGMNIIFLPAPAEEEAMSSC